MGDVSGGRRDDGLPLSARCSRELANPFTRPNETTDDTDGTDREGKHQMPCLRDLRASEVNSFWKTEG
jgi:hypothetical protein